ncbi:carbon-nitrogen hydrolase family protein [Methylovirgula sp. 4M-Z18]|uniref:carbon-nitrogen hydrolase family protein n=1 Tax=Methylovirgula sp. 4M-Z18 TaxID=2293567 RepID=UPI000E2FF194|nr:carbon-nitrogen hydrolase family protein [Methylovirgula sp. 4M-Z18]RFB81240.1 carbon-nitrogen hydrolase [Methylovirgula sp. 4M-Z18]
MRIGILQGPEVADSPSANLERLGRAISTAGQPRLMITPEMFMTGYNIGPAATAAAAQAADGEWSAAIAALARQSGSAILYGYPERGIDGKVYNSAQLIDRDGRRLANHRKAHLFGEIDRSAFAEGDGEAVVTELDGVKIGLLICYEVEFPENVRLLALAGAEFVAVPTALMQPYTFIAREMVRTRAYENQVFLAYANRCGAEGDLTYLGQSCIVAPDGSDLARATTNEDVIAANLDFAGMAGSRALNTYLHDRRPEVYRPLTHPH